MKTVRRSVARVLLAVMTALLVMSSPATAQSDQQQVEDLEANLRDHAKDFDVEWDVDKHITFEMVKKSEVQTAKLIAEARRVGATPAEDRADTDRAIGMLSDWIRKQPPGRDIAAMRAYRIDDLNIVGLFPATSVEFDVDFQSLQWEGATLNNLGVMLTVDEAESEEAVVAVPDSRSFGFASSGGTPFPNCTNDMCIEHGWLKERDYDERNTSYDWYGYQVWTEAESQRGTWVDIYDVDEMSQFTQSTINSGKVVDPKVIDNYPTLTGSCSQFNVGSSYGGISLSIPIRSCATTKRKTSLTGGMHVEYRDSSPNEQLIKIGHTIVVQTRSGYHPYWKDYADVSYVVRSQFSDRWVYDFCAYNTSSCWA